MCLCKQELLFCSSLTAHLVIDLNVFSVSSVLRCFAALGDVSKARFIQQINDKIEEISSATGTDGSRHPVVQAKLAVLNKKFKQAEGIYLEQGMVDQAMEMYQELHKWDDSLEIAARKVSLEFQAI